MKSEENGLGSYVKNNIQPLLIAVKTRRIIICEERDDLKEFKTRKTKKSE